MSSTGAKEAKRVSQTKRQIGQTLLLIQANKGCMTGTASVQIGLTAAEKPRL